MDTLDKLGLIKYGEVPSTCHEASNAKAPPLIEGEYYAAVAYIYDHEAINVQFSVEDGKAIPHSWVK